MIARCCWMLGLVMVGLASPLTVMGWQAELPTWLEPVMPATSALLSDDLPMPDLPALEEPLPEESLPEETLPEETLPEEPKTDLATEPAWPDPAAAVRLAELEVRASDVEALLAAEREESKDRKSQLERLQARIVKLEQQTAQISRVAYVATSPPRTCCCCCCRPRGRLFRR